MHGQARDTIPNILQEVTIGSMHITDSLRNAPASISILSKKDLTKNNAADISIPINTVAGVFMQSGGYNTNRISIRGIGARTPYGTNKIRAFYGTIPLTSGDSETTIEDIDIENISRIEIIKGPLSSIYGAGLGGALVVTPQLSGANGNNAMISTTFGSYNLIKNTLSFNHNASNYSLNASYHKMETDGWRENSSYNREGITLAGELFRNKNGKLTYFGNYTFLKAFIPSSIDKTTFENNPRSAAFTWKSAKGYESYDSYLAGFSYEWKLSEKVNNSTSVFLNHKESDEPRPFDILLQNTTGYGVRSQFSGSFDSKKNISFIAGLEYFRDDFKGRTFENLYENNNGKGSLAGFLLTESMQNRSFYNVFGQMRIKLSKKTEFQGGINLNQTQFELDAKLPENNSENYRYDLIFSPHAAFLFKPNEDRTFYISASRGFSLPSVEETLTANGTINSGIKPENGYNFEIGQKSWFLNKKLHTEISVYHMQIKDLLVARRVGDDQYVGINAGETLHQGIEVLAEYTTGGIISLNPYISASIGRYEFKEFIDGENDFSGNDLTGVPSNKINAGAVLNAFEFYLSADYQFVDTIPLNDANLGYTKSYQVLNLKTGWKKELFPNFTAHFSAGINNVGDTRYASMVLVNAAAFGNANPRFYYPGLPVNYYGNFGLAYNF